MPAADKGGPAGAGADLRAGEDGRQRICGIPVYSGAHEKVLEAMERNIRGSRRPMYISITNTEAMYHARRDAGHREYIEKARFSLCDGIGIVVGARLQGKCLRRFNGPLLLGMACHYGASRGWRHFFCGGKEGVATKLSARLAGQYPGLICAGSFAPPFRPMTSAEEELMLRAINEARPDILWVGLGLPKQERFIAQYLERLKVPWLVGVGAAFDMHAGTAHWAPPWIRSLGFEWLYRLCFEPRMLKRNLWSFICLADMLREAARLRVISFRQGRAKT